jgi:SAM-dependent methyltransferase
MAHSAFSEDVDKFGGYQYTSTALSCRLSNARINSEIHRLVNFKGKTILDIGCGDGTYTIQYAEEGASHVLGVDPVENAIARACSQYRNVPNIEFKCYDILEFPIPERKFDVAVLRGVLHHLETEDLGAGIRIACQLARQVVVMEPNGFNPVLKVLERFSPYHIAHKEKSFLPATIRRLFRNCGGAVKEATYVGLVPFFCPDAFAKILKSVEPLVESVPLVRQLACGQYMILLDVID